MVSNINFPDKIEVCCGDTCTNRGSGDVFDTLRKDSDIGSSEITMTSCFGACEKGVNIVVDENRILHYTTSRNIVERIAAGEGQPFHHYDEASLDLENDFLGDL